MVLHFCRYAGCVIFLAGRAGQRKYGTETETEKMEWLYYLLGAAAVVLLTVRAIYRARREKKSA